MIHLHVARGEKIVPKTRSTTGAEWYCGFLYKVTNTRHSVHDKLKYYYTKKWTGNKCTDAGSS